MTLIPNWKQVLLKAWSIYAYIAIILCAIAEAVFPVFAQSIGLDSTSVVVVVGFLASAGAVFRLIDQKLGIVPPNV